MVSPLNVKVLAGAAALITGILGGALVAGASSSDAQAPAVGPATPSRVASPSAPAAQVNLPAVAPRASHQKPTKPEHARHHVHRDGANN